MQSLDSKRQQSCERVAEGERSVSRARPFQGPHREAAEGHLRLSHVRFMPTASSSRTGSSSKRRGALLAQQKIAAVDLLRRAARILPHVIPVALHRTVGQRRGSGSHTFPVAVLCHHARPSGCSAAATATGRSAPVQGYGHCQVVLSGGRAAARDRSRGQFGRVGCPDVERVLSCVAVGTSGEAVPAWAEVAVSASLERAELPSRRRAASASPWSRSALPEGPQNGVAAFPEPIRGGIVLVPEERAVKPSSLVDWPTAAFRSMIVAIRRLPWVSRPRLQPARRSAARTTPRRERRAAIIRTGVPAIPVAGAVLAITAGPDPVVSPDPARAPPSVISATTLASEAHAPRQGAQAKLAAAPSAKMRPRPRPTASLAASISVLHLSPGPRPRPTADLVADRAPLSSPRPKQRNPVAIAVSRGNVPKELISPVSAATTTAQNALPPITDIVEDAHALIGDSAALAPRRSRPRLPRGIDLSRGTRRTAPWPTRCRCGHIPPRHTLLPLGRHDLRGRASGAV